MKNKNTIWWNQNYCSQSCLKNLLTVLPLGVPTAAAGWTLTPNGGCWYKGSVQKARGYQTVCRKILITEDTFINKSRQDITLQDDLNEHR